MAIRKIFSKRQRRPLWKIDAWIGPRGKKTRVRDHAYETKRDAEQALAEIRAHERKAKFGVLVDRPRLADLIEQRIPTIKNKDEKTRAKRILTTWLALLPSNIRVDEISSPFIRLYAEKRERDGLIASSISRELNTITATLNAAGEFFPELSQWQKPKTPRPKVSKSRRERVITDEEYRAIIAKLTRPPDPSEGSTAYRQRNAHSARLRMAAIFRFAMATGMRPQEIYTLPWSSIEWDNQRIKVYGQKVEMKVNPVRYVPLSETVREILESQKEFSTKRKYIFTRGPEATAKMYRVLKDAAEACGIPYGNKKENAFVLYCARHTFTTRLLQSGLDMRTVGDITGHSDRQMILHYSHVTPESRARAMKAMDGIEAERDGHNYGHNAIQNP
jgi:integrase